MKVLYAGFDLCDPTTSVSMTINGPAPTILAMFLNTAIDQQLDRFRGEQGASPTTAERAEVRAWALPTCGAPCRPTSSRRTRARTPASSPPSSRCGMMADIAGVVRRARGPQLLLGVDLRLPHRRGRREPHQPARVHARQRVHLRRGVPRPRAWTSTTSRPNLSFFFSNGMDPEYTVLGRVARRIWAVAMRERYGANERSQKLKYHVQTSGRSLHAQEMDVQRHPHHAAGAVRDLRQRQQPAHQRLRRGGHHARPPSRCAGRWPSS